MSPPKHGGAGLILPGAGHSCGSQGDRHWVLSGLKLYPSVP